MVADKKKKGVIIVDPRDPAWHEATIVGAGELPGTFKARFFDGETHPGVPFAHLRRKQ